MTEIIIVLGVIGLFFQFLFFKFNKNNIWNHITIGGLIILVLIILIVKISNYNTIENSAPMSLGLSWTVIIGGGMVLLNFLIYYFIKSNF